MRKTVGWILLAILFSACEGSGADTAEGVDTVGLRLLAVPVEHRSGGELFGAHCSACHGTAALGTERGPPLVHPVYRPGHHADAAFLLAVQRGVRAHHWGFGDMPPLPEVSAAQATRIVGYVRWLQQQAGIE